MEPWGAAEVEMGPGNSKTGVAIDSVATGEESPSGVEAWSVANRSGVGEEATGRLHPTVKRKRKIAKRDWNLFIQLN
jgi:hypothetical protein